jgi:hypothetical protein
MEECLVPAHRNQRFQWLGATTGMPKMRKVKLRTCTQNNYFDQCVVYRGSTAMTLPLLSTARLTFLPSGVETIARLLSRQLIRSQTIDLERF